MNANRPTLRVVFPDAAHLDEVRPLETAELGPASELNVVLAAWHTATDRLQKTHEILCAEVRRLTEELEVKNRELARKNRLEDLGQMASHVAHEVRNALAPVTLYLSHFRRKFRSDQESLRLLDKLEAGFTALEATVHDMLSFASDRAPSWGQFQLGDLITEVFETLDPQLAAHDISTEMDVPPQMIVWCDRDMLRRALLNLALNAVDVMPRGGALLVTAYEDAGGFEIEVADTGPGVREDLVPHIFEPFFTTKSDGAGLGLAIVYRVAEAHGGTARIKNCPEGGAAFTIRIPRKALEAAA